MWERDPNDDRPVNPRIFQIPNTPEVFIGDGEPVIIWHADRGGTSTSTSASWLGVVGKTMRRVPADQVKNYILGYTNTNDISDRQGRGADDWPSASNDPLLRKGKDSSKPIGPFIVPAEFVDPLNMRLKMTVGGVLVQDATTNQAWHNMYEYGDLPLEPDHGAGRHGDRAWARRPARMAASGASWSTATSRSARTRGWAP